MRILSVPGTGCLFVTVALCFAACGADSLDGVSQSAPKGHNLGDEMASDSPPDGTLSKPPLSIPGISTKPEDGIALYHIPSARGGLTYYKLSRYPGGGAEFFVEGTNGLAKPIREEDLTIDLASERHVQALTSSYIQNIQVIAGTSGSISCPGGYLKNPVDLNSGASGKFIYLCYTFDTALRNANGVNDLDVYNTGGSGTLSPPAGYYAAPTGLQSNGDLNQGAGGDFIWFIAKSGSDRLIGLGFVASNNSNASCPSGWAKVSTTFNGVNGDLNRGASGQFVYLCKQS